MALKMVHNGLLAMFSQKIKLAILTGRTPLEMKEQRATLSLNPRLPRVHDALNELMIVALVDHVLVSFRLSFCL